MSFTGTINTSHAATRAARPILPQPEGIFTLGDLLPLCDFVAVLVASCCALLMHFDIFATASTAAWIDLGNLTFMGALLATCILYDQQFAANLARRWVLAGSYVIRALLVVATVYMAGTATELTFHVPASWLQLWLCCALAFTASSRWYVARKLRSRAGRNSEGIYEYQQPARDWQ